MLDRLLSRTTLLTSAAILCGCAPVRQIPTPKDKQVLDAVLSELALDTETTCAELRDAFDVEHLPVVQTPDEIGMDYTEHWLSMPDGTPLRIWHLPSNLDRGTVVLSTGAVGEMACYLFITRLLVNNGWSVVMYDYRGFGGSAGEPDLDTLAGDLDVIVDWTLALVPHERVALMGISLGSMPSIAVAVDRPQDVSGVILDSPVVLSDQFRRLDFVLGDQTQTFIDLLAPSLVSENLISRMHTPLLMLIADKDRLVRPAAAQQLFDAAPGPKTLARFPDVGHARAPYQATGEYTLQIETFLSQINGQFVPIEASPEAP
ncbi:MAG: alpha/beta fold hydrolase [Planctomycetota bacterium]|nr:MAG: alpha/beta fold hydrolase [Planctomycetota bacterium]